MSGAHRSQSLDCNMLDHHDGELLVGMERLFAYFHVFDRLDVDIDRFRTFLASVHANYRRNPFHNFAHSFSVTQMLFLFLDKGEVSVQLELMDIFTLLVAAVCHDLDHPGLNNGFQLNTDSVTALIWGEESPLESYHAACATHLLELEGCNFLHRWKPADRRKFRMRVCKTILATDMGKHFFIIDKVRRCGDGGADGVPQIQTRITHDDYLNLDNKDDLQMLFNLILKCADVSNEVRPYEISKRWAGRLVEEFLEQGNLERHLSLNVTPLFEKDKLVLHKMQISFIENILMPMYTIATALLPGMQFFEKRWAFGRRHLG